MTDISPASLPGPEYPNSPLAGVVFEIRFPGEPAIECHRDEFFADARAEFPNVFVPKIKVGDAVALAPYHFQRVDGSASLLTALNLFAYQTRAYPGFSRFRVEALKWTETFARRFHLGKLMRTGLRYTNVIPYAPGEKFPVSNFLDVDMKVGEVRSSNFNRFELVAVIPAERGTLTVQIKELEGVDDTEQSAILLDFDFGMAENLHVSHVAKYLDDSHQETKRLFEGLLTPSYRAYLRGEGLK